MARQKIKITENQKCLCQNCKKFSPNISIHPYSHPCSERIKIPTVFCKSMLPITPIINNQKTNFPTVSEVRKRIESVKNEPIRIFLKALYILGAARAVELAAGRPNSEKKKYVLYGVTGDDVSLDEVNPPDPRWETQLQMLLDIQQGKVTLEDVIRKAKQKTPIAVFKIPVAKTRPKPKCKADIPYRLVALPLDPKFEPWTQQIYDYYQKHKGKNVFPFSRVYVEDYLDRKETIFKGLHYQIKKYVYLAAKDEKLTIEQLEQVKHGLYSELQGKRKNVYGNKITLIGDYEYKIDSSGQIFKRLMFYVDGHLKPLKLHGLRHIRTDELLKDYEFDGIDLAAYVGWGFRIKTIHGGTTELPEQAFDYTDVRQCYERYVAKLLIEPKYKNESSSIRIHN
jgi:hypothetical protein